MSNGDLPEAPPNAIPESIPENPIPQPETRAPEYPTTEPEATFTIAPSAPDEKRPMPTALAVVISACGWAIPGLGHLLLGRWVRSLLFATSVFALFLLGLMMEGRLYSWEFDYSSTAQSRPLQALEFFGDAGVGAPYFVAMKMGLDRGNLENRTYDYGEKFLWVAGLLNYLIVLDAFDVAMGRKP
jgi:hypothetical protein